jgi:NADPH:quinone reductase-like Zn-dependent oxidoreductase
LAKRVSEATGNAKIRLGIDAVGGKSTDNVASCIANEGVLVNYGLMSGESCVVSPASFVFRDMTLRGFWLALWFRKATPPQQMAVFGELAKLIATGKLKARVQATYDISQIKEAVTAAAAGEREGKILMVPKH